jgi:hypothetical protein
MQTGDSSSLLMFGKLADRSALEPAAMNEPMGRANNLRGCTSRYEHINSYKRISGPFWISSTNQRTTFTLNEKDNWIIRKKKVSFIQMRVNDGVSWPDICIYFSFPSEK